MPFRARLLCLLMLWAALFTLTGCFYREPVRHLTSDICLITPDLTQQQVLATLGPPDYRKTTPESEEIWVYYEVKKSLLRKTPYLGDKLGNQNYDVVTISFANGQVRTCVYRSLNEQEFKELGIPARATLGE